MHVEDLLREFGRQIGLPDLALDPSNVCHVIFDDVHDVTIETDAERKQLYVHASIGKMPVVNKGPYYEKLLHLALFGTGLGGASAGLDPHQGDVILWRHFTCEGLDVIAFTKAMELFLHVISTVPQSLDPLRQGDEAGPATGTDRFGRMGQGMIMA